MMSTSSLTALPSSDAPASDRSLALPEPSRPTARRTYGGRRREPSPQPDSDAPSLAALFASSDSAPALEIHGPAIGESPSKALLNRFSTSATGWMTSLGGLGAGDVEDEDENAGDEEALKREMAKLRQAARGGPSSSRIVDLPAPSALSEPRKYSTAGLHATSSTSILTAAPTSPLRSSPPPLPSSALPAVASEDASTESATRPEKPLSESSEDEETRPLQRHRKSTPTSDRSITPTPATKSNKSRNVSPSPSPSATPPRAQEVKKSKAKTNRLQAFMAGLNEDENVPVAVSRARSSPPRSDPVHEFLATLQGNDDDDEDSRSNEEELVKRTSSISVGLFDDEEESNAAQNGKQKKIKSLPKKDVAQMHKDVAAAKRERHFQPFKPEVDRLPVSSWAKKAQEMLKDPVPALVRDDGSRGSSPSQVTPDEITAFTPSSSTKPDGRPTLKNLHAKRHTLSPTPVFKGKAVNANAFDEDEDAGHSLGDRLDKDLARFEARDAVQARIQMLKLKKQAIIREMQWQSKQERKADSDEELSIVPKPDPVVRFAADVQPNARHRTAKSVLDNYMHQHDQIAKSRQAVLKLAGRKSSPHEEVTETMADFAGKTFKHADLRAANGGARPAGQKRNREVLITQNDLNHLTMTQHQQQAALLRRKKELMFNVRKKLVIPPRQIEKLDAMIESLAAREEAGISLDDEEDDEEEEGEDDDFEPSGSEAEGEEEEAGEAIQYSGDEDEEANVATGEEDIDAEEEDADRMDIELEADVDGDKENEPPTSETSGKPESALPLGTPRQPIVTTSRSQRTPLGEIEADQSSSTPRGFASTFVDVAGFGSGSGSPGFSQLFEATQAAGPSGEADAFAALRDQHDVLLPSHALLPQVEITKTQLERDNAMIAADGEDDNGDDMLDERPKTQYLNDKGLFTQTKPLARSKDASAGSRDDLAGSSVLFGDLAPEGPDERYELSSTQKGTSEGEALDDDEEEEQSSPRSGTPTRRHSLAPTEGDEVEQDVPKEEQPIRSRPVDAFTKLMSAGQRPLTEHQKRAKRLIRSNLVDEQAEESDEDDWMVGSKSDDEEENDGEEDAYLAELVNDEAVSAEEKRKQDELATAKAREMQMADDAKREAAARKITEGEYRHKRRGKDFWSDDEDGSPRKKRWSKKERRARKAWKEDGLEKLDGEQNVFHEFYDNDLDSDVDSVEEVPTPRKKTARAGSASPMRTGAERLEMLRRVARMNKAAESLHEEVDLDKELGPGRAVSPEEGEDTDTDPVEEESQYSISRSTRILNSVTEISTSSTKLRSAESYQAFVRDESQLTRRTGAIGAASVVYNKGAIPTGKPGYGNRPHLSRQRASGASSSSGGSILMSKTGKFA